MKKLKKIFLIFICFLLIFSIIQIPTSAIAVEIIGGSYVAYAILAAALAAAGYTIATNQIDAATFQAILDSSGAEDIKAMITATQVFTSVNGRVFFNWSSSQWFRFVTWVNSVIASGELVIPAPSPDVPPISNSFEFSTPSSYIAQYVPSSTALIGWSLGSASASVAVYNTSRRVLEIHLSNALLYSVSSGGAFNNSAGSTYYFFGSPCYFSGNSLLLTLGVGVDSSGTRTTNRDNIARVGRIVETTMNRINYNDVVYTTAFSSGIVYLINYATNVSYQITGTALFPTTYSSIVEWWTDVINTGSLVGDFTGIGEDVINPADNDDIEVGIDAYPNWRVGTGIDALPDELDTGTSIDIPLNPYIDTDLGPDVVDPYVDFTPWDTDVVPPDDVIPDININPPADVVADPDIPFADDQTYPLEYPTDTDTPLLPDDPNPNTPPSGDDSNKMKLLPLILSKFPFCLPWDLQHGFKSLVVSGSPPVFDIPLRSVSAGINENIHIDLSRFNTVASISRWFFSALWIVLLILITRKIVWK